MPNIQPSNLIEPRLPRLGVPSVVGGALRAACVPVATQSVDRDCVKGVRRLVFLALAGLFFVLGMIGIVLPGLPTTPMLLLTSYFLARSWPRMHRKLLANKLLGPILCHWHQHRAVEPRTKVQAAFLVGLAMALLFFFSSLPLTQRVAVLAFASIGLLTIYKLPTLRSAEATAPEKNS